MSRRGKTILIGALVTALALAVAVPAFAAPRDTPTTSTGVICPGGGYGGGPGVGGMRGLGAGGRMSAAIADLLGMQPADLQAARQAGRSLAEIATDQGISADTLINGLLKTRKAALADAVAGGRITQERADLMLQNMSDRIADRIDDTEVGPPADRGGHGRGGRGDGARDGCGTCRGGCDGRGGYGTWAGSGQ